MLDQNNPVHTSQQHSANSISTDFQTSAGLIISKKTVHWELHDMVLHGCEAPVVN